MEPVQVLRQLWSRKVLVAIVVVVAIFAAILSAYRVSVSSGPECQGLGPPPGRRAQEPANVDAVPLADVGNALKLLEPLCAEMCARREDRDVTVVPALTAIHEAAEAAIDDPLEVIRQSRLFHETLAKQCGNETLTLVVGALEELWSEHEAAWARAGAGSADK